MKDWEFICGDCLKVLPTLEADSVSLVFGSPPYRLARTYGIDFNLADQAWVDWMVQVYRECLRVCTGLVAFVVEGQTVDFRWTSEPAMLMTDLHRAGICLRRPVIYHRVGIPGSGGPDWLRADTEYIVCAARPGRLPFSDNTACGHPPKWAPGGEMSYRLSDGTRTNQWGGHKRSSQQRKKDGSRQPPTRPSHEFATVAEATEEAEAPASGLFGNLPTSSGREKDGRKKKRLGRGMANGVEGSTKGSCAYRLRTGPDNGEEQQYKPPTLANPGNVVFEGSDFIHCNVGGGQMGEQSGMASLNEAPFPESLCEFFIRSFCPPGGLCLDPFAGSGTTAAVAYRLGRRALGVDIRQSQIEIATKRLENETREMFV